MARGSGGAGPFDNGQPRPLWQAVAEADSNGLAPVVGGSSPGPEPDPTGARDPVFGISKAGSRRGIGLLLARRNHLHACYLHAHDAASPKGPDPSLETEIRELRDASRRLVRVLGLIHARMGRARVARRPSATP